MKLIFPKIRKDTTKIANVAVVIDTTGPFEDQKPKNSTMTNSEDTEEMLNKVAFHQDLHCFLRPNRSSEK